jgi:hypothetical protein
VVKKSVYLALRLQCLVGDLVESIFASLNKPPAQMLFAPVLIVLNNKSLLTSKPAHPNLAVFPNPAWQQTWHLRVVSFRLVMNFNNGYWTTMQQVDLGLTWAPMLMKTATINSMASSTKLI